MEYVPIELPPEAVGKISLDGLLIHVPGKEQSDIVFIDSSHVDYCKETGRYTIWLAPPYQYYCVPKTLDPDLLESEQLSGKPFRGMDLIRRMERAWGGQVQWINIPPDWVHSANQRGLLLSIPEAGVEWLHIEPEDFELTGTGCRVRVFPHWSYAKDFYGTELIAAAENQRTLPVIDLLWIKYRSYERRSQKAELELLSKTLWTMERENITEHSGFALCAKELKAQIRQNRKRSQDISTECEEYTRALTSLKVVSEYEQLHCEWKASSGRRRVDLEASNTVKLRMYERAIQQIIGLGIAPTSDPEKIKEYISFNKKELERLKREQQELQERLSSVYHAEQTVNEILAPPSLSNAANQLIHRNNYTL